MAKLDTVTSSTRPASPVAGKAYYETDTNKVIVWTGSEWTELVSDYTPSFSNTYSLSFDGTDDYMDCSSTFTSLWSGSFSISLWLKTPGSFASGVDNYLGNDFVVGQGYIEFRQRQVSSSTANIEFFLGNSITGSSPYGSYGAETAAVLNANSWYHLVLTADRPSSGTTTATLYINGSPTTLTNLLGFLSTLPNAGGTWSNNTLIAARNTASSGSGAGELNLDGHLDEMAFFNSVLTSSDVSTIYNSGVPDNLSSLSPVNWWRMGDNDGGTGTTITDQGSGGNDGTLINGPAFSTDIPS